MSQIFEALRRTRDQDRHERGAQRGARADAVLATMGFASERKRSARERFAPFVLLALIGVMAWLGWRWYSTTPTHPFRPQQPVVRQETPRPAPLTHADPPPLNLPAPAAPPAAAVPPSRVHRPDTVTPASGSNATRVANRDPLNLAIYYQRSGDFENALAQYRAALQKNELDARAHNNLGLLYRDKGLIEDAVRHFQRALTIEPRYATARNNLGVALLGQGHVDEARAAFSQVLALQPRNVGALVNLALAEQSAGRPAVAMETLVRAIALDSRNAPAHYNLAVLYEQSGEAARAVDHYRAFLVHAGPQDAVRAPEVRARIAELTKTDSGSGRESVNRPVRRIRESEADSRIHGLTPNRLR